MVRGAWQAHKELDMTEVTEHTHMHSACLLMCRVQFLFCYLFDMHNLALQLAGLWEGSDFSC